MVLYIGGMKCEIVTTTWAYQLSGPIATWETICANEWSNGKTDTKKGFIYIIKWKNGRKFYLDEKKYLKNNAKIIVKKINQWQQEIYNA